MHCHLALDDTLRSVSHTAHTAYGWADDDVSVCVRVSFNGAHRVDQPPNQPTNRSTMFEQIYTCSRVCVPTGTQIYTTHKNLSQSQRGKKYSPYKQLSPVY